MFVVGNDILFKYHMLYITVIWNALWFLSCKLLDLYLCQLSGCQSIFHFPEPNVVRCLNVTLIAFTNVQHSCRMWYADQLGILWQIEDHNVLSKYIVGPQLCYCSIYIRYFYRFQSLPSYTYSNRYLSFESISIYTIVSD